MKKLSIFLAGLLSFCIFLGGCQGSQTESNSDTSNAEVSETQDLSNTDSAISEFIPYPVQIKVSEIGVYDGPGYTYQIIKDIKDKGTYVIVETSIDIQSNMWGKLETGGWINLNIANMETAEQSVQQSSASKANKSSTAVAPPSSASSAVISKKPTSSAATVSSITSSAAASSSAPKTSSSSPPDIPSLPSSSSSGVVSQTLNPNYKPNKTPIQKSTIVNGVKFNYKTFYKLDDYRYIDIDSITITYEGEPAAGREKYYIEVKGNTQYKYANPDSNFKLTCNGFMANSSSKYFLTDIKIGYVGTFHVQSTIYSFSSIVRVDIGSL